MKTFDAIVAGAGIWGCTVARRLAEAGKKVLVLEKRAAVGGNCRCEIDPETGIEVHTYGSHIFHTSNEEVWAFVRRFTKFNGYRHCVLAKTRKCGRDFEPCRNVERVDGKCLNVGMGECLNGEGKKVGRESRSKADGSSNSNIIIDRRACAEKKVEEWLAGVDEAAFEAALVKLVSEKSAAGEYVFEQDGERAKAIVWAKRFYLEFSHKLIELSDGRYVYFVPDVRARDRGVDNPRAWAEYAFHAVSTGGKRVPGKMYFVRHFSDVKCENIARVEETLRREDCFAAIEEGRPERAAIHFVGISTRGKRFDVVTRLDEFGNAEANLSEVTVVMTKKKYSEKDPPPMFRPLTEVVETVVKHQAAGFSPSTTQDSIANGSDSDKGGEEKKLPQLVSFTEAIRTVVSHQTATGTCPPNGDSIAFSEMASKGGWQAAGRNNGLSGLRGDGEGNYLYHLPIGKTLLEEFFGVSMKERNLKEFLAKPVGAASTGASHTYGDAVFDAFICGYTSKQWGVAPEKVDPSIIARLKVRDNYSTDYFDDPYQGIPSDGYNTLFEKLLCHPNIEVRTSCSLKLKLKNGEYDFLIHDEHTHKEIPLFNFNSKLQLYYSGPIDALFNYKFGALPWRTLRFEREMVNCVDYQGTSVVNYTDADVPYTRIHEFKHYHPEKAEVRVGGEGEQRRLVSKWGFDAPKTVIMREYSAQWQQGDEPYYPINTPDSAALLAQYQAEVERFNQQFRHSINSDNQTFLTVGGRLGQYKYFDMDKSIEAALKVAMFEFADT